MSCFEMALGYKKVLDQFWLKNLCFVRIFRLLPIIVLINFFFQLYYFSGAGFDFVHAPLAYIFFINFVCHEICHSLAALEVFFIFSNLYCFDNILGFYQFLTMNTAVLQGTIMATASHGIHRINRHAKNNFEGNTERLITYLNRKKYFWFNREIN